MVIDILTLFPEGFSYLDTSIIARAKSSGKVEINLINIRDFSLDKHKKCDDTPFGGGAGMLMTPQPIYDAVMSVKRENSKIILPSPSGSVFSAEKARDLAKNEHILMICGHYEGIDQRIIDIFEPEEISIGDYVLTGGELPAMVIVDSLLRFVDGVITKESLDEESFSTGLLEYPQYTRPQVFKGLEVPFVLTNGNHKEIKKWQREKAIEKTKKVRPDLLEEKKLKRRFANSCSGIYTQKRVDEDFFKGYLSHIKVKVDKPVIVNDSIKNICVKDNDYEWILAYPDGENYAITIMFDKVGKIVQWYFDIAKQTGTENGIPFEDDLYLDFIITRDLKKIVADEDELKEAFNQGKITKKDVDLAYKTLSKLETKYYENKPNLFELTNKFCELMGSKFRV